MRNARLAIDCGCLLALVIGAAPRDVVAAAGDAAAELRAVTLNTAQVTELQIRTEPVRAWPRPAVLNGTGQVLDPAPLLSLFSEAAATAAAATATSADLRRLQELATQEGTSQRALEAARAQAARDDALARTAEQRLVLAAGPARRWLGTVSNPELSAGSRCLLRIDLPASASVGQISEIRVSLAGSAPQSSAKRATLLGPAPVIDPAFQGRSLLASAQDCWAAGTAISAELRLAVATGGWLAVPRDALLLTGGSAAVIVFRPPGNFVEVPVVTHDSSPTAVAVTGQLRAQDRVVTQGAGQVLSALDLPAAD